MIAPWCCFRPDPATARGDDVARQGPEPEPAPGVPLPTRQQRLGADALVDELTRHWTRRHEAERLCGRRPPRASLPRGLLVRDRPDGTTRAQLDRIEWLLHHRVGLLIDLGPQPRAVDPASLSHLREPGREGGLRLVQAERWPAGESPSSVLRKHELWLWLKGPDQWAVAELTELQAMWPVGDSVPRLLHQLSGLVLDFQHRRPTRTVAVHGPAGNSSAGMLTVAVQVRRRMTAGERGETLVNSLRDALLQWQDHCGEPRSLASRQAVLPLLALCEHWEAVAPSELSERSAPSAPGRDPWDAPQAAAPRGSA